MAATTTTGSRPRVSRIEPVGQIAAMLAGIFVFFTLAFQPFQIPSGSMKPTLQIGDYFLASKYDYGYSGHSLPFAPPLAPFCGSSRGTPARGDVVLFHPVSDPTRVLIKRLIGLPGDRIQVIRGLLHINRGAVARERMPAVVDEDCGAVRRSAKRCRTASAM